MAVCFYVVADQMAKYRTIRTAYDRVRDSFRGGSNMELIVYDPKEREQQEQLYKKVAIIHAQAIVSYIQNLGYAKSDKASLMEPLGVCDKTARRIAESEQDAGGTL